MVRKSEIIFIFLFPSFTKYVNTGVKLTITAAALWSVGLEELKIWVHVFLCTPIQVCVDVVHAASFVHMNYLCMHACMQIVYATVYVIMYLM